MPKGKLFRYTGTADERAFTEDDFKRHGVDDQGEVKFNAANAKMAHLSQAAAEFLAQQRESFELVEDTDAAETQIAVAYASAVAAEELPAEAADLVVGEGHVATTPDTGTATGDTGATTGGTEAKSKARRASKAS